MEKQNLVRREIGLLSILSIIFIVLFCIILSGKKNLCEDEVFSYGSANHPDYPLMRVENGVVYEKGATPFEDYVYAKPDFRFQYVNVWKNQKIDVHPPLYYMCLHTVCSLFPNTFSIWYGGVVNLVWGTATLWVLFFLMMELDVDRKAVIMICLSYTLTAGIYQLGTFFRMYMMAMFFCTLLTWINVYVYHHGLEKKLWLALGLGITAVFGVLTHYYVVIYIIFQASTVGVLLIIEKRWRTFGRYCVTMLGAAGTAIALFPPMLEHVFFRYRGEESFHNLMNWDDAFNRWKEFGRYINQEVWGNGAGVILLAGIAFFIVFRFQKHNVERNRMKEAGILLVPCTFCYIIISKIAVYVTSRYIAPIYAILLISGYLMIWSVISKVIRNQAKYIFFGAILAALSVNGFRICPWSYSFRNETSHKALEFAQENGTIPCLYVYKQGTEWAVAASYFEIREYSEVLFVTEEEMNQIPVDEMQNADGLIVYIEKDCDRDSVLKKIEQSFPDLSEKEEILSSGYTAVYRVK